MNDAVSTKVAAQAFTDADGRQTPKEDHFYVIGGRR